MRMAKDHKYSFHKSALRLDVHTHLGFPGNPSKCFTAEERMLFDCIFGIDRSVILPYPVNDLPMLKTFINAYAPTREYIWAAVEKIIGKSEFKGKANELVRCDRWDTRR